MSIDDHTRKVILFFLAKWKTTRVSKDKLLQLKEELMKKDEAKPISLPALKKIVRRVVKETSQAEKIKEIKLEGTTSLMPITVPVTDNAFRQIVAFDIAASRRTIIKINEKIDDVREATEKQPKQFKHQLSSELTGMRRELDKLVTKLAEVERQLILKGVKR